jgi:Spy/CpxP family protein refolding chaperone
MRTVRIGLGSFLLVALVASGMLFGQDEKPGTKAKGSLPQYWSKLGLTDEQKAKVYSIQSDYNAKINALDAQIKQLRKQERDEMGKVLTDAQKARLKEILTSKVPGEEKKPEKKPGDK